MYSQCGWRPVPHAAGTPGVFKIKNAQYSKKADTITFKIVMSSNVAKIPWSTADDAALIDLVAQRSSGVDLIWEDVGKKSIELNLFAEIDGFMPLILRSSLELGAPKKTQLSDSCTFSSTAVSLLLLGICLGR